MLNVEPATIFKRLAMKYGCQRNNSLKYMGNNVWTNRRIGFIQRQPTFVIRIQWIQLRYTPVQTEMDQHFDVGFSGTKPQDLFALKNCFF